VTKDKFDTVAYAAANTDLATANITTPAALYEHFAKFGFAETRPGVQTTDGVAITDGVAGGAVGTTFTLTTNIDNLVGTAGNDKFIASSPTLTAGDSIDGGAGAADTLSVVDTAGGVSTILATVTGVENVSIKDAVVAAGAATHDLAGVSGLKSLVVENDNNAGNTTTVQGIASTVGVTLDKQTDGTVALVYSDAAATGDQTATITYTGGTGAAGTNMTAAGVEVVNLVSSGTASDVGDLTFAAAKTVNINAGSALKMVDLNLGNAVTTALNISGSALVTATAVTTDAALKTVALTETASYRQDDALSTSVTSVDASKTTGTLEVTSGATTTAITGGVGNDNITIGGAVYSGAAKLDGGDGTDILAINDNTTTVFTTAAKANISNFETLEVSSGATKTFDFSALTGLTGLIVNTATSAIVNKLSTAVATAGVLISGVQTTALTVNVTDATSVGNTDTLKLTLDHETANTAVTVAAFAAAGVEKLNVVSEGAGTNTNTLDLTAANTGLVNVNISGASNFTLTDSADIAGQQIVDASNATGVVTVALNQDTEGTAITGGSGNDVLEANSGADIIKGGAGNDTITFENSTTTADNLTGGAGNDIFKMATDIAATVVTHNILDFDDGASNSAVDTIQFSLTALAGLTTVTALSDTSDNDSGAGEGTVVKLTADAATVANADLVVLNQNYANAAAVITGLQTGGNSTITFGAALDDNDAFMVAYTDGTDGFLAVATHGGGGATSNGVDSVENVVKLAGVTDFSNFDTSDFSYIA
jgi:hypothetical protein